MNMINIFREYIKYQSIAKRRHGIHSPFVYDFGDKCLNIVVPKDNLIVFRSLRTSFLKDQTPVQFNIDFNSSVPSEIISPICKYIKMNEVNEKLGKLYFRLTAHYRIHNALELGTNVGLGTYMIASGNKRTKITTVEPNQDLLTLAKSHFPSGNKENIKFIHDSFLHYLNNQKGSISYDLVVIDGNQWNKNNFEKMLELLKARIHDETIILIKNIRRSNEISEIWQECIKNPEFHLSMDFFSVGILLQRNHQQKEHFIIRY